MGLLMLGCVPLEQNVMDAQETNQLTQRLAGRLGAQIQADPLSSEARSSRYGYRI